MTRTLTLVLVLALANPIQSLDGSVQRAVQAARRPALERPMRMATDAGRPLTVTALLAGILIFDRAAGPVTVASAALGFLLTNAAVEGLKYATDRTRPDGDHNRRNASFPSSHAANGFLLAAVLARRWPRIQAVWWLLATFVALSRVYLNRHWASDAVAGAALGILFAWIAAVAMRRWWPRRAKREEAARTGA